MRRNFKPGKGGMRPIVRAARPIVRAAVRPIVRQAIRPPMRVVPPVVAQAHHLMGKSKYQDAGNLFEQIAQGMQANGARQAPQFFLQAGRARMLAGDTPAGMALLKMGLSALANAGNLALLLVIGRRLIAELTQGGYNSEAGQIQEMLDQNIPQQVDDTPDTPAMRVLPTNCPSCGGPLLPKEVEWLDEITGECPYCGNGVRVETPEAADPEGSTD